MSNPYREWSVQQLSSELEVVRWRLAEYDRDYPTLDCTESCTMNALLFCVEDIEEIEAELARRRRLRDSEFAPKIGKIVRTDIFKVVKESVQLEGFCHRYGPVLEPRGNVMWGLCPLPDHHERHASFKIDPRIELWHCFGCHRGGDLFTLGGYYYQLDSLIEVARKIADEFGVVIAPAPSPNGHHPPNGNGANGRVTRSAPAYQFPALPGAKS